MARLILRSHADRLAELGQRARALRKLRRLTQRQLSSRADVSVRSLQRFEQTGSGSIELLMRVAHALRAEDATDALFALPPAASLDDFMRRQTARFRRKPTTVPATTKERINGVDPTGAIRSDTDTTDHAADE